MSTTSKLPRLLRGAALVVGLAASGGWLATGAHLGWTQTSVVQLQRDEITGIDFPVRRAAFVAGVEVLAAGLLLAGGLGATALFLDRRRPAGA
ncbi:MAG: hypothetical protein HZC55_08555 [Verrucomicrobia bacterium]|nr:hypothetical protein [Verrucomicrobiota bacterium]